HRDLLSFPTRRSSDRGGGGVAGAAASRPHPASHGSIRRKRRLRLLIGVMVAQASRPCGGRLSSTEQFTNGFVLSAAVTNGYQPRSEEHTSELQSRENL